METAVHSPLHRHIICWKSALAGLAISLITFSAVVALFVAFGGITLSDGTTMKRMSTLTAFGLVAAVFLSGVAGAYYSVRVARLKVDLAGIAQGGLVGALMLLVVFCGGFSAVGTMVKATGAAIGGAAAGSAAVASDPMVQEILEDGMGGLNLRSDPSVVAKGLASRLIRGDAESAKNYLAYQASLTREQADQRIEQAKAKVDEALVKAREAAATGLKVAGWAVFLLVCLGMMAAGMGGYFGTLMNDRYCLDMSDEEVRRLRTLNPKV